MKAESLKADGVLLFITAIWGVTFIVVKDALSLADPYSFLSLRFTVGAAALVVFSFRELRDARVWKRGGVLGILLFTGYAFQTVGLKYSTPSRSAFITGLIVIFIPFVSWGFLRKRPSWTVLVGALIATAGLTQLTNLTVEFSLPWGDVLSLGCAVAYAVQIVLTGEMAREVSPLALVTAELTVTAALSWVSKAFTASNVSYTPALWGAVLVTGLIASAFAIGVQTWAQARTSAVHVGLIFTLEPVFAAAFSTALGREVLSMREWFGGGLILAGVAFGELIPLLRNKSAPAE